MDQYTLFAGQFLTFKEHYLPDGHNACSGSGTALALRLVYKALEEDTADITQAAWLTGDGGSPIQARKSGAAPPLLSIPKANGTKILICFDNEPGAKKTAAEDLLKKQPAVASASGCAYAATASPSHPFDLIGKIRKAWSVNGSAYVHILCPCPLTWGFDSQDTVRVARMAVESRLFPLYEIIDDNYRITVREKNPRPLKDYTDRQGRFADWKPKKLAECQQQVNASFESLSNLAARGL